MLLWLIAFVATILSIEYIACFADWGARGRSRKCSCALLMRCVKMNSARVHDHLTCLHLSATNAFCVCLLDFAEFKRQVHRRACRDQLMAQHNAQKRIERKEVQETLIRGVLLTRQLHR